MHPIVFVALSIVLVTLGTVAGVRGDSNDDPLVVRTTAGWARGAEVDGVRTFLGIPFARDPVGTLRWRRPLPASRWEGIRNFTSFGDSCIQLPSIYAAGNPAVSQSEACLNLNVYAPVNLTSPAAVMVFIHGGGYIFGSPDFFNPINLVKTNRVIFVGIKYRLGMFGFFGHSEIAKLQPSSGTLGLQDQQAALKWVQQNIGRFGGDPDNVTIFGQSAGGGSVAMHLVLSGSLGLFNKAIVESGTPLWNLPTATQANTQAAQLATAVNCTSSSLNIVQCLLAKPASILATALPLNQALVVGNTGARWFPVVDGVELHAQPIELFNSGRFARNIEAVMLGNVKDEATFFVYPALGFGPIDQPSFNSIVSATLNDASYAQAAAQFYGAEPYAVALNDLVADFWWNCQSLLLAPILARYNVPTYLFRFDYTYDTPAPFIGAYHGVEQPFVFNNPSVLRGPFTATEQSLANRVQSYWVSLAKFANPNVGAVTGAPVWPLASATNVQQLVLDLNVSVTSGYRASQCSFWASSLGL